MADYVVKPGDTLWGIATKHGSKISGSTTAAKIKTLQKVNGIKEPDKIYVGQKINFSSKSKSGSTSKKSSKNKPTIAGIGLSSTDTNGRTVYVIWNHTWDYTKGYKHDWWYYNKDTKRWIQGDNGEKDGYGKRYCFSEYSPPENATQVRFRVKPIAKTYKPSGSNNDKPRWTNGEWSEYATYKFSYNPPLTPAKPTITLRDDNLTFDIEIDPIGTKDGDLTANEYGAKYINFEIFKSNSKVKTISKVSIKEPRDQYYRVATKYTGDCGGEYKVRAQSVSSKDKTSGWSEFSNVIYTKPAAPKSAPTCKAKRVKDETTGETTVYAVVSWKKVTNADSYIIEYTTNEYDFDPKNATPGYQTVDNVENTSANIKLYTVGSTSEASGGKYYFRVKAVWDESKEHSDPSLVGSLTVGESPAAPTAWSNAKSAFVGEPLEFNWTHNARDGSLQTSAKIKLRIFDSDDSNGITVTLEGENDTYSTDTKEKKHDAVNDDDGKTYGWFYSYKGALRFELNTNLDVLQDVGIEWCVQTAGVTGKYDNNAWSTPGTVYIYSKPELALSVTTDMAGENVFTSAVIPAATYYYAVEYDSDDDTYSRVVDTDGDFEYLDSPSGVITEFTVDDMPVYQTEDGIYYCVETYGEPTTITNALQQFPFYIRAQVIIESNEIQRPIGYTVRVVSDNYYETTDSVGKTKIVNPGDDVYSNYFNAVESITTDSTFDPLIVEMSAANIDLEPLNSYKVYCDVDMSTGLAISNNVSFNVCWEDVEYTIDADVTIDTDNYTATIVPVCKNLAGELIENVTVSVYRREYDGQFTELSTDVPNNGTSVPDPHPALDYARYRLIAKDVGTGAISFYDRPGEPVGCTSIVIQWDEAWTTYDITDSSNMETPLWSGSMLVLPYNIKVSDKRSRDVARVTYAGRQYPVSYHGTAISEASSWSTVIPKDDTETIYALRRLSLWSGPVYVREPSGMGFWANVIPSFNIDSTSVSIPVTLDITRVEGGA